MERRRLLVTGGSGFLGTNVVERFRSLGWETHNFDVDPPKASAHREAWTRVDILDRDRFIAETRSRQPEIVLHLAARTDLAEERNLAGYAANIEGVCNLVDAVRASGSVRRVIVASSQLVCRLGYRPKDNYDFQPSTLYGRSKVLTERIVHAAADGDSTWTIVRPTSLWGPWFGVPLRNLFLLVRRGRYVQAAGVTTWKQWGFVGNTVFQIERLIEAPVDSVHRKTFYLADYEPVELSDFVERVRRAFGARAVLRAPAPALWAAALLGDVAKRVGWSNPPLSTFRYRNIVTDEIQDVGPIRAISGPLPFTVDEGIAMTVRWLRDAEASRTSS